MSNANDSRFASTAAGAIANTHTVYCEPIDYAAELYGDALNMSVQLTESSSFQAINTHEIPATFILNVPIENGFKAVKRRFKIIDSIVTNYQTKYETSWYWDNMDILEMLLAPNETLGSLDMHTVRAQHRKYSRRLAHLVYHLFESTKYLGASFANLCILGRINGSDERKQEANECKAGYVMGRSNKLSSIPMPKYYRDWLIANSKLAFGSTTYGAKVTAFPHWFTAPYGNAGNHAPDFKSFFTDSYLNFKDRNKSYAACFSFSGSRRDSGQIEELYLNMRRTIKSFSSSQTKPRPIRFENGAVLSYCSNTTSESAKTYLAALNLDESLVDYSKRDSQTTSGLADNAYETLNFWVKYITAQFPEACTPNSLFQTKVLYEMFKDEWDSTWSDDLRSKMYRSIANERMGWDINSLLNVMHYKGNNESLTTATLINYSPLQCQSDLLFASKSSRKNTSGDPQNMGYGNEFANNFERYAVTQNDEVGKALLNSKDWPMPNPTIFCSAANNEDDFYGNSSRAIKPFVVNGPISEGPWLQHKGDASAVFGRDAVLFEQACAGSLGTVHSEIITKCIDTESAKKFVGGISNAYVFNDEPSTLRTDVRPIIDNTDIYQCGFAVLLMDGISNHNVWDDYFRLDKRLDSGQAVTDIKDGFDDADRPYFNTLNNKSDEHVGLMHVSNPNYMKYIKTAAIFVGSAILQHPLQMIANKGSSMPYSYCNGTILKESEASAAVKYLGQSCLYDGKAHTYATKLGAAIGSILLTAGSVNSELNGALHKIPQPIEVFTRMFADFAAIEDGDVPTFEVRQYTFNPAYGPITPCYTTLDVDFDAYNIAFDADRDSILSPRTTVACNPIVINRANPIGVSQTITKFDSLITFTDLNGSNNIAPYTWIPVIDKVVFTPMVHHSEAGGDDITPVSDRPYEQIYTPLAHWPLRMMARVRVGFLGTKHLVNFIDYEDKIPYFDSIAVDKVSAANKSTLAVYTPPKITGNFSGSSWKAARDTSEGDDSKSEGSGSKRNDSKTDKKSTGGRNSNDKQNKRNNNKSNNRKPYQPNSKSDILSPEQSKSAYAKEEADAAEEVSKKVVTEAEMALDAMKS